MMMMTVGRGKMMERQRHRRLRLGLRIHRWRSSRSQLGSKLCKVLGIRKRRGRNRRAHRKEAHRPKQKILRSRKESHLKI
jgi:F420-0:gamma-glutamyl ligase-like protein